MNGLVSLLFCYARNALPVSFMLSVLCLLLMSCGLPDSRILTGLSPAIPDVSLAYSDGNQIIIELENDYPEANATNFEGFNLYFSTDSDESNRVLARLIYVTDREREPSLSVSPNDAQEKIELRFPGPPSSSDRPILEYRFTDKAVDLDFEDANLAEGDTNIQTILVAEGADFYILVKAVNDESESRASDISRIRIPRASETNITILPGEQKELARFSDNAIIVTNTAGVAQVKLKDEDEYITVKSYYTAIAADCYKTSESSESGFGESSVLRPVGEKIIFVYKKETQIDGGEGESTFSYYRFYVQLIEGPDPASGSITLELCRNNGFSQNE